MEPGPLSPELMDGLWSLVRIMLWFAFFGTAIVFGWGLARNGARWALLVAWSTTVSCLIGIGSVVVIESRDRPVLPLVMGLVAFLAAVGLLVLVGLRVRDHVYYGAPLIPRRRRLEPAVSLQK